MRELSALYFGCGHDCDHYSREGCGRGQDSGENGQQQILHLQLLVSQTLISLLLYGKIYVLLVLTPFLNSPLW